MNNSTNNIHNSGNLNNNNNSSSGNNTSDNSNNTGVGGFSFGFNAGRSSIPPASRVGNGRDSAKTGFAGIEGMLGGLSELFKTLTDLAEKGQEMKNSGEFSTGQAGQRGSQGSQGKQGKDVKFQYGFSVKTMNNGQDVKVEPFGNFKRDENTGDAVVHEVREPMADVMDEADGTVIVLEMPGIAAGDVKLSAAGDVLTITADRGSKRYRKELLLPATFDTAKMAVTCNNGVVEIRCGK